MTVDEEFPDLENEFHEINATTQSSQDKTIQVCPSIGTAGNLYMYNYSYNIHANIAGVQTNRVQSCDVGVQCSLLPAPALNVSSMSDSLQTESDIDVASEISSDSSDSEYDPAEERYMQHESSIIIME